MKCPDTKYLSLFADGELSPDTDEYKHIKNCDKCMREIKLYQKIGHYIHDSARISHTNITERIKNRVRKNLSTIKFNNPMVRPIEDSELENLAAAKQEEYLKDDDPKNKI